MVSPGHMYIEIKLHGLNRLYINVYIAIHTYDICIKTILKEEVMNLGGGMLGKRNSRGNKVGDM